MQKTIKLVAAIITIIAGIIAIISFINQYTRTKPIIEIKTITKDKLTDLPSIDGLVADYKYKDSTVKSLWKLDYYISNSGDEITIGEGTKKNIIKDQITFNLKGDFKILDFKIVNQSFPFNSVLNTNRLAINFLQWKPKESFEIVLYVEQLTDSLHPNLTTDEREVINSEIKYSVIQKETEIKKSIFDLLPKFLREFLRWLGLIVFGLVIILMPVVWISEAIPFFKYKKWYKSDYWMYKEWIDEEIKKGTIDQYYDPPKLPIKHWTIYPYPKPTFSTNDFGSMTLGVFILLIFTLIPMLLLIRI